MPLYEYKCSDCGEQFETLVTSRDKANKATCPSCGSGKTERMLSTFAVGKPSAPASSCATGTCPL